MLCIECNLYKANKESGWCNDCEKKEETKINGILYLPALELIIGILSSVYNAYSVILTTWPHINILVNVINYSTGVVLLSVLNLLVTIYCAWLFFNRNKKSRYSMISYYIFNMLLALYFTILPSQMYNLKLGSNDIAMLTCGMTGIVFWIPYFIFSKRINKVFHR